MAWIMKENGIAQRTVFDVLRKLEQRGAIIRPYDPGPAQRHFVIPPSKTPWKRRKKNGAAGAHELQGSAGKPAEACMKDMQHSAHIKDKGKKQRKTKDNADRGILSFMTVNIAPEDHSSLEAWKDWVLSFTEYDWETLLTNLWDGNHYQFPSRYPRSGDDIAEKKVLSFLELMTCSGRYQ